MKFFAAVVAFGALCQAAIAQAPDCKSIPNPAARLACYDKAAPPATEPVSARPRLRMVAPAQVDGAKDVDSRSTEDVRLNAQLKHICRGC
jgi:hypothetical protein